MNEYYKENEPLSLAKNANESESAFYSRKILFIIVGLYVCSLFLPAVSFSDGSIRTGWEILLIGWVALFVLTPSWFANITFAIALLNFKKTWVWGLSLTTVILGLTTYILIGANISFSGTANTIQHLGVGFYVWEFSFISLFLMNVLQKIKG